MTIEIGNSITNGQPANPNEESQNGIAKQRPSAPEQETSKPTDTVSITENGKHAQLAQESMSTLPVVDPKRVEDAKIRLSNGTLDILSNDPAKKAAAAERLANKLFDFEMMLEDTQDGKK